MKRSICLLSVILVASILSGCIINKSPKSNDVIVAPGVATTFKVTIFPSGGTYTWTLDGTQQSNTTNSYQYTTTSGQHTLVVSATHILGTDTQSWNITCPEASAPIDSSGGTVVVTNPASPIAGAQSEIPAGALATTVTITISQATAPDGLPSQSAGPCVNFGPDGTQFITPVEITLPYADEDNDGLVDGVGVSEDQIKAYFFNDSLDAWEEVPVIARDESANFVRIHANHFSKYTTGVPEVITWQKIYGGSTYDQGINLQQTIDGGYIVAGQSFSSNIPGTTNNGAPDIYIFKLNEYGELLWNKMYGGSDGETSWSIQQTIDGGYIIAGSSVSSDIPGTTYHGGCDIYIIKVDADGELIWHKMYGGSACEIAGVIKQTADGGYIIAGMSESNDIPGLINHGDNDFYIIKLDINGDIVWNRLYGGSNFDATVSIHQTNDGGYIVAGVSDSADIPGVTNHGQMDIYIIKIDMAGQILWHKMYGGSGPESGSGFVSISETSDGGFIIACDSESTDIPGATNHGSWDYYVIKVDEFGNISWQQLYGGSGPEAIGLFSVYQVTDGGYVVVGYSGSSDIPGTIYNGGYDSYIVKIDGDGILQWQKMYGGSGNDFTYSSQETNDGGYIIAGDSDSTDIPGVTNNGATDIYILKLDSDGNL